MVANVSAVDSSGILPVIGDDEVEEPDIPDLYIEEDYNVTSDNIDRYFPNGVLASNYSDCALNLIGEFRDIGILEIAQKNVTINGKNCVLINTFLDISGSDILLSNITFILNDSYDEIEGSAILIRGDDVTVNNVLIDYTTPEDTTAYGIYSYGTSLNPVNNLTIINSNIAFKGQNYNRDVYNYALRMDYSPNALIYNNTINTKLVLRGVNFAGGRVASDSDYSLSIGASHCDGLVFVGNNVTSDAIGRSFGYPTLDCFFIWGCDNSWIVDNSFTLTDFFTYVSVENYLYGLDIYSLENMTIAYNNISILTTGGRLSAGAAYPIQLTGPLNNVSIVYNDLYSLSNGPNIGIYSSNSGGNTALLIAYNKINITGLAGEDSWALVSGIEGQDSRDIIMNNIIEVHSVGEVNENTNIYGVSYAQSTAGDHNFDIINNTVLSDGFYSVYLESAVNSTITHNTLISYHEDIEDGRNGYKKGDGVHEREMSFNNLVFNEFDYNAQRANDIDSGYVFNYTDVVNDRNLSNILNGSGIEGKNIFNRPDFNPLIRNSTIRHHTGGGAALNYPEDDDAKSGENPFNPNGGGNSSDSNQQYNNGTGDVSPSNSSSSANTTDGNGDKGENTNSSSDTPNSGEMELPDTPDGDNGYIVDYNYHPRNPSANQNSNSTNTYTPSGGNYTKDGGLNLLDMLISYVNSNTEGGRENVSSYNGETHSINETAAGPSTEGEDSSIGASKSVDASDSTEDTSSNSYAGDSTSNSQDSSKTAYELNDVVKKIQDNLALAIALIILCLICLIVGYKRQNSI